MFWWLYKSPVQSSSDWPLILWLQGGPGASGVGLGNFEEIGPLTTSLLPRQHTWLTKSHLLFVDSPVGTGFSYVANDSLLLTNDEDVAIDLTTFLQAFFESHPELQSSPFFVFAESYGGKHAALLGLELNSAIRMGCVKAKLGGIALGDSWISPIDSVFSWGPVLKAFSRIDNHQEQIITGKAKEIQENIKNGAFLDATRGWSFLESLILNMSNNVDFYNILSDESDSSSSSLFETQQKQNSFQRYGHYLKMQRIKQLNQSVPDLASIMNGPIRKKLQIIPDGIIWRELAGSVFSALTQEFMRDVVAKVDELLTRGVNVAIYSGQLDLICATQGTEDWVKKLRWEGMAAFKDANRKPLFCNGTGNTAGFVKAYKNLTFYWVLFAGHMVPADNPCIALEIVESITNSI
ncbi:hypothetical protein KP509_28G032400 [Ceratopteris richardii]|uniref:Carboxypeptidase n=1 Tax=Ceratopteris richardii TaxID=49495 RepID=A0A8T2RAZ7_CERRI|nr:hypothetical protein KP509_28G032400 [Ceratopteris richardii]